MYGLGSVSEIKEGMEGQGLAPAGQRPTALPQVGLKYHKKKTPPPTNPNCSKVSPVITMTGFVF